MSRVLNALSFDVEDYFQVSAFNDVIDRSSWEIQPRRVGENTRAILDLLAAHEVKATFYVLGWVAERHPDLVKAIARGGHEIASHGYSHKLIYSQSRDEFAEETRRSKGILEDLAQVSVTSYRAASYSITAESLWALDVLHEAGFSTDSSIFPIRHDRYGLMGGPLQPYYIDLPGGGRILEYPISTLQRLGLNLPVSGGGYFRLYPYALSRCLARQVNAEGRPFVFYLHPWEVDPDQPRVDVGPLTRFRHYNNLAKCRGRLERLLRDFRFGTVSESVAANYGRDARLPSHSYYPPVP